MKKTVQDVLKETSVALTSYEIGGLVGLDRKRVDVILEDLSFQRAAIYTPRMEWGVKPIPREIMPHEEKGLWARMPDAEYLFENRIESIRKRIEKYYSTKIEKLEDAEAVLMKSGKLKYRKRNSEALGVLEERKRKYRNAIDNVSVP
jgi:hypothetical protein